MTKDCSSKWRYLMAAVAGGMLFANLFAGAATARNVLITVAEAAYPDSADVRMATRSGSFGPEIELVTPTSEVRSLSH